MGKENGAVACFRKQKGGPAAFSYLEKEEGEKTRRRILLRTA